MKKWIYMLTCLGYLTPAFASQHASFLTTGEDLHEMSYYDNILETPNFFTQVYPENLNPHLVLVPRTNSGFFFGLEGFYQRPFDNQLDFTITDPQPPGSPFVGPNSQIKSLDPDYEFGYGAFVGYVYPYLGRDIKLDVFTFSGNKNGTISASNGGTLWTPLSLYDLTTQASQADAKLTVDVDEAKLMIGQHAFGGTHFHIHPYLGVAYASISRSLSTTYFNALDTFSGPINGNAFIEEKSKFTGVGPAVKVDARYYFGPEFGIIGHLTSAILIGNIQSSINYKNTVTTEEPIDATAITLKSTDRAVPNLNGQLGFMYHHPFCGTHTRLELELGYQFNHYFNAEDLYRSTGIIFATPFHVKNVHDLTLDGPYFSIGLSGIACPNDVVIDPLFVGVPQLEGGFIFGIGGGYLRLENNQMDFALLDPRAFDFIAPSTESTLHSVEMDYTYALMLSAGYIFRNSPHDFIINYRQLQIKDDNNVKPPSIDGSIWTILSTPSFDTVTSRAIAEEAGAKASFHYYEGNLQFGQTISAASLFWLRLFEGLQYTSLDYNFHTTYNKVSPIGTPLGPIFPQEDIIQKSSFQGIGPLLGFDMTLPVGGFALSSQLSGGLLIGSSDSSYKDLFPVAVNADGDPLPLNGELGTSVEGENQYVPFVNLKVGLAYTFNFFNRTRWTLDFGYMAAHYFNAATTFRHATNNAAVFIKQVSDVTLDGPYLNLTVFGFGGCPPDCIIRQPFPAFAPVLRGGFEFAAEAMNLEIQTPNLDYGILDPTPQFILPLADPDALPINPSINSKMQVLNPGQEFAYRVHFGYIFPLSANDVSINFADLKGTPSASATAPTNGVIWTVTNGNFNATVPLGFFPVFANKAEIDTKFSWQTGNIEVGRRLKFYQLMTRFFAGLTYARVIEDINITYTDGVLVTTADGTLLPVSSDLLVQSNSFYGIGPRFGLATDLAFACGFSLVGQIGTDLLVGHLNSGLAETSSAGVTTSLNPGRRDRLVPAVDLKLGLAYTIPLRDCAQIGVEGGYQVNHYFNAVDSLRFTDNFSTFIKQNQDISFDGPYVRVQVSF